MIIASCWALFLIALILVELNKGELFSPIVFFSLGYSLFLIPAYYFYYIGFPEGSPQRLIAPNACLNTLVSTINFIAASHIVFSFGYYLTSMLRKNKSRDIAFKIKMDPSIDIRLLTTLFLASVINFAYAVQFFSNGSIINFIATLGHRRIEYLTTLNYTGIGFILGEISSLFLIPYMLLKQRYKATALILLVSIIIKLTTGRIASTMTYLVAVLCIAHFMTNFQQRLKSKLFMICIGIVLFFSAIALHFFRFYSSLSVKEEISAALFHYINSLGYYLVEKGNTPYIPILMRIIENADAAPLLYGRTLTNAFLAFLPNDFRPIELISWTMFRTYYWQISDGGAPPTVIGELILNFGKNGALIFMFFFGLLCRISFNYFNKSTSIYLLVAYALFCTRFLFILPKTQFDSFALYYYIVIYAIYIASAKQLFSLTKLNYFKRKQNEK